MRRAGLNASWTFDAGECPDEPWCRGCICNKGNYIVNAEKHVFVSRSPTSSRYWKKYSSPAKDVKKKKKKSNLPLFCFFFTTSLTFRFSASVASAELRGEFSWRSGCKRRGWWAFFWSQVSALWSAHGGMQPKAEEREGGKKRKKREQREEEDCSDATKRGEEGKGKSKMWLLPGRGKYQLECQGCIILLKFCFSLCCRCVSFWTFKFCLTIEALFYLSRVPACRHHRFSLPLCCAAPKQINPSSLG